MIRSGDMTPVDLPIPGNEAMMFDDDSINKGFAIAMAAIVIALILVGGCR